MLAKQIKYTDEFRKKAVNAYLEGNLSAAQLAPQIGVHKHTLCKWIKLYSTDGFETKQTSDFRQAKAQAYIDAIKKHITELEILLSQQEEFNNSKF